MNHTFFCGCKAPSEIIFGTMKRWRDWMPHLWGHILTQCTLFLSGSFPAPFLMDHMVSVEGKHHQRLSLAPWKKRLDATPLGLHTDSVHSVPVWLIPCPIPNGPYGFCGRKAPSEIIFGTMKAETGCHTFGATYWHSVLTVHVWVRPRQLAMAVYASEMGPWSCSLCV